MGQFSWRCSFFFEGGDLFFVYFFWEGGCGVGGRYVLFRTYVVVQEFTSKKVTSMFWNLYETVSTYTYVILLIMLLL